MTRSREFQVVVLGAGEHVPRDMSRCRPLLLSCAHVVCVLLHVRTSTRSNTRRVSPDPTDTGVCLSLSLGGVGKSCLTGEWSPPIGMGISCSPPVETTLSNHPEPWFT